MKGAMSERQMGLGIAPIYKNLGSFGFGMSVLDGLVMPASKKKPSAVGLH